MAQKQGKFFRPQAPHPRVVTGKWCGPVLKGGYQAVAFTGGRNHRTKTPGPPPVHVPLPRANHPSARQKWVWTVKGAASPVQAGGTGVEKKGESGWSGTKKSPRAGVFQGVAAALRGTPHSSSSPPPLFCRGSDNFFNEWEILRGRVSFGQKA